MILSIITPTLGNTTNLKRLFQSLMIQDLSESAEIILSTTDIDGNALLADLGPLPPHFSVQVLSNPKRGIAAARNRGLRAARGKYVFFLDDDCSLPRATYLTHALSNLQQHIPTAWAGDYIVADSDLKFFSAFYNYMSTLWLKSFADGDQLKMVLGGCALFHRETLLSSGALFEENEDKAAEEYSFSQKLIQTNISIFYSQELSVNHNPGCPFKTLMRKSWNHGRALGTYSKTPHQKRWNSYWTQIQREPLQALRFLPMLVIFLAVGRFAFFWRRSFETVKSTHRPYLKRS